MTPVTERGRVSTFCLDAASGYLVIGATCTPRKIELLQCSHLHEGWIRATCHGSRGRHLVQLVSSASRLHKCFYTIADRCMSPNDREEGAHAMPLTTPAIGQRPPSRVRHSRALDRSGIAQCGPKFPPRKSGAGVARSWWRWPDGARTRTVDGPRKRALTRMWLNELMRQFFTDF